LLFPDPYSLDLGLLSEIRNLESEIRLFTDNRQLKTDNRSGAFFRLPLADEKTALYAPSPQRRAAPPPGFPLQSLARNSPGRVDIAPRPPAVL
jgi:hypothetical protein